MEPARAVAPYTLLSRSPNGHTTGAVRLAGGCQRAGLTGADVRLWALQAVVVALMAIVGAVVANAPQIRTPAKLNTMCENLRPGADPTGEAICAEFSGG